MSLCVFCVPLSEVFFVLWLYLQERPPSQKWQKLEASRHYQHGNQLREYQLEGMNWLLFNWFNR